MEKELNQLTLIGRTETTGKKYPLFLERIGLVFSIVITIFLTTELLNYFEWSIGYNIIFYSCLAPLFALSFAEIIGRIIQNFKN